MCSFDGAPLFEYICAGDATIATIHMKRIAERANREYSSIIRSSAFVLQQTVTTFISPLLLFSDDHPHSYSPLKRDMCVCVCVANCNWNQLRDASRACEDLKKSLFMIGSQLGRTIAMGDEKSRTFVDRLLLFHCWFDPWMNNYIFVFIVSSLFFFIDKLDRTPSSQSSPICRFFCFLSREKQCQAADISMS